MTTEARRIESYTDRVGRAMARRLDDAASALPYEVTERLRAARVRALQMRKQPERNPVAALLAAGGAAVLGRGNDDGLGLWGRIASALPLIALAAGLVFIHSVQNERRASELAEVDAQLLTDDLPPAAYADPGFVHFLKSGGGGE